MKVAKTGKRIANGLTGKPALIIDLFRENLMLADTIAILFARRRIPTNVAAADRAIVVNIGFDPNLAQNTAQHVYDVVKPHIQVVKGDVHNLFGYAYGFEVLRSYEFTMSPILQSIITLAHDSGTLSQEQDVEVGTFPDEENLIAWHEVNYARRTISFP